jgi:hypothetical protein
MPRLIPAIRRTTLREVEGIELTLIFLRAKRNQAQRALSMAPGSVALGIPTRH